MTALGIGWIVINSLVAVHACHLAFVNSAYRVAARRLHWRNLDAVFIAFFLVCVFAHSAVAVCAAIFVSIGATTVLTALLALTWSGIAYFMNQRFAGPSERPFLVSQHPNLLPLQAFASFISTLLALLIFAKWYWSPTAILAWYALGYACAEAAIRRYIARSQEAGGNADRSLAIFAINSEQGRGDFRHDPKRFPFP